ncbi:MAG: hypothetical protein AMJ78_07805 [Omnitrophica WOR_2 bacterium SM23_29]|nr:MAG: hypothetical protein AMJ78_07805 [Omnitrophica WOR_2 bacterium SM23_29]
MKQKFETKIGSESLILETGKLAKQANGAVTVQYGGTVVLVSVVMSKEPAEERASFIPLTVEYQEKTYAAGKIPGGFFKREGRPSEKEVLTARLVDRPLRPLFPDGFSHEIQIIAIVLSHDGENDPDILAVNGASCALIISDIPFEHTIGAVRVGMVDGQFIINPTYTQLQKSVLDLVVAGTKDGIIMVEAGINEVEEEVVLKAVEFGHKNLIAAIELQEEMKQKVSKPKEKEITIKLVDEALYIKVKELAANRIKEVEGVSTKDQREEIIGLITKDLVKEIVVEGSPYAEEDIKAALVKVEREEVRRIVIEKKVRIDNRGYKDVRSISCEVGILPRTHGSGVFTRGQTQSLSVTTLGTSADEQLIDALEGESFKSFMLHYSFPPFSVGEVKPVRGPGRREIGHGALAERALKPIMPSKEEFPYTIRVVSEILESNGSSSMATVCAGTLALMDAGVPIKSPVSGIAMGLIKENDQAVILTDISGLEDHFGDMDFKITGTEKGVTALQLDIKVDSISCDIFKKALEQSHEARLFVLEKMKETISAPRQQLSEYAPRITTIKINPDKIRELIGPGGKTIRKIIDETGVTIDIEDDGKVNIASTDKSAMEKAIEIVNKLTRVPEVGKIYMGKVKRIMPFGAFVEVLPDQEGLVHISELSDKFVKNVEDEVRVGDEFLVKVIEIDEQGRVNLSRKQAMGKGEGNADERRRHKK